MVSGPLTGIPIPSFFVALIYSSKRRLLPHLYANSPCLPVFDCYFSRISQLTDVKIGVNALYYKRLYQNKTSENAIFSPISPFIRKKGLEITIIKRKEENIQLSIIMYHQSAHIILHYIKSVISKWCIRLLK